MPALLIVNADDFGLTAGVNRAVAELHQAGVLSSATLMANGAAFDNAVAVARANPELGVGCHIVLTDGVPVSDPAAIPTLMDPDASGLLRRSLSHFVRALVSGRIREEEIATEALAQVRKLQQNGVRVTHLDTHKHTHLFPAVLRPLLRVTQQSGIGAIRYPFEPAWAAKLGYGSRLRRALVVSTNILKPRFSRLLGSSGIKSADGTLAISATGDLTKISLERILRNFPAEGIYELCCHPGYNDAGLDAVPTRLRKHREVECDALLSVVAHMLNEPNAPRLVSYAELGPGSIGPSEPGLFA